MKNGRGREIRTPDILLPKQARYQTALYPDKDIQAAISASLRGRILLTDPLSVNLESAVLSTVFSVVFLSTANKLPTLPLQRTHNNHDCHYNAL